MTTTASTKMATRDATAPETYQVSAALVVPAPASTAYALIADYRHGHPRILPPAYFASLEVESGGVGAGTAIRFEMRVLGRTHALRAVIAEPEPGRVLTEHVTTTGAFTTFTVEPVDGGSARVTITTDMPRRAGLGGYLERVFTASFLRRVYRAELAQLGDVVGQRQQH